MSPQDDIDGTETRDWVGALKAVQAHRGVARTNHLVNRLVAEARREGVYLPTSLRPRTAQPA